MPSAKNLAMITSEDQLHNNVSFQPHSRSRYTCICRRLTPAGLSTTHRCHNLQHRDSPQCRRVHHPFHQSSHGRHRSNALPETARMLFFGYCLVITWDDRLDARLFRHAKVPPQCTARNPNCCHAEITAQDRTSCLRVL